ncbi:hypothetical protein A0O34_15165 [Chryseobacterium glaciei]|uniref:Uncharacterized protein n=1 Tax=Chryseobacterium glaciei TaxID=1685010 RepID=A0A172XXM5_9FLAO|nr:hypothetical protein [Chryseobacterium glaciei]ANF51763.1 hypothetical protein A0O34_15165 [Chryseobacterium glaciei]
MKENSYIEVKNYFENLSVQANFINDFVGFFQREWANRTASVKGLKTPALALFKYDLGFDGPDQNTVAVRKLGFAIMFNNIKPDDLEGQYIAIHDAEQLALKVLGRIRYDSNTPDHPLFNSFLKDSVEINPVELSGGEVGVDVLFNFKNKQLLKVDPEDWEDIENICQ